MKKLVFTIIMMVCWATIDAQQKQIVYGQIDQNGLDKVTKGAMWTKRPWAKMAYYGQKPQGVDTVTLMEPHFAQFVEGENNPLDINFIVLDKGTKICYKDSFPYLDYCGNRLKNLWPVNSVKIVRDTILKEVIKVVEPEPVIIDIEVNNIINGDSVTERRDTIISSFPKKGSRVFLKINNEINFLNTSDEVPKLPKKSNFWKIAGPILGVAILAGAAYIVYNNSGGPGGAPLSPPDITPPPPVPTDGPGGAPLTRAPKFVLGFSFGF